MCARRLRSRHFQYKEYIVQATMNRFDGILSLPLLATPAFTDMQTGLSQVRMMHWPTCRIAALASSATSHAKSSLRSGIC